MDIKYGRRGLVSIEEKRELIKKNIPKHRFGIRATELIVNVVKGTIEKGCSKDTHNVVKMLIGCVIEDLNCDYFMKGAFRKYHSSIFWIGCEIIPPPEIAEKDIKKFVEGIERLVEIAMQNRYGLKVIFGSPPQWQQR